MSKAWEIIIEDAVAFRHELHAHPELTWKEKSTTVRIREELDRAGIRWDACTETGTIARVAENASGRHIALRGDIDALPIHEAGKMPWVSKNKGCMHACGHDGHSATLLAAARWLKQHESSLPGPVSLFFQPAEEGGHGAKRMIEAGALEGIDYIYGWHNWPVIPFGKALCPDGPVMAANGSFGVSLTGRGGHASQPDNCRSPVFAAAAVIRAFQDLTSEHVPRDKAVVACVTSVKAESADTVIPDTAVLRGSLRIADERMREDVQERIVKTAKESASTCGVEADVKITPGYPGTINDPESAAVFREALVEEFGPDWQYADLPVPIMASEDFSYYLQKIPGAYALIGAGDGGAHAEPCHSTRFDFNDALIPRMIKVYSRLAGAPLPPH